MALHIITVVPISRAARVEHLTYFSRAALCVGSIVSVPVRSKSVPALIIHMERVENAKAEIKSRGYALKKIDVNDAHSIIRPAFITASERTATYFATTLGALLHVLIPRVIRLRFASLSPLEHTERTTPTTVEKRILQADDLERMSQYRSIIREAFARKTSVFFCVPSIHAIDEFLPLLKKGIEDYTYIAHQGLSARALAALWHDIAGMRHPILVIGTAPFLCLPRTDFATIIIEREGSRAYKSLRRPFVDMRIFVEHFAEEVGAQLIFGDSFLSLQTLERHAEAQIGEVATPTFRILSPVTTAIIGMKEKSEQERGFELLSKDLRDLIRYAHTRDEHLFLYTARRGLSPQTVCGDCGALFACSTCDAPLVVHEKKGERRFLCHHCGSEESAIAVCRTCKSWKLVMLGISSGLIEKTLAEEFPTIPRFRLDSDTASSRKESEHISRTWRNTAGSILIGTEKALKDVHKTTHSAVVSMDSLFSIPDFSINERIFRTLLSLRAKTTHSLLVQTRETHTHILQHALSGNVQAFWRQERILRKRFNYPPFSILLRIDIEGGRERTLDETALLADKLGMYQPTVFPTPIKLSASHIRTSTLIRISPKQWPSKELTGILHRLPHSHTVHIAPDSLLS